MAKETSSDEEAAGKLEEMECGCYNSQRGHNDWQKKISGRCNGKEKDRCVTHTGDEVEGTEGLGDGKWIQIYYVGETSGRNSVGILLSSGMKEGVLKVNRESCRLISIKINVDGYPLNVVCAYAPQMGCDEEDFWGLLENMMLQILENEALWIRADFNDHVGEGNGGNRK